MAALISFRGAVAIPIAFAVTASIETLVLAAVLLSRIQRRLALAPVPVTR